MLGDDLCTKVLTAELERLNLCLHHLEFLKSINVYKAYLRAHSDDSVMLTDQKHVLAVNSIANHLVKMYISEVNTPPASVFATLQSSEHPRITLRTCGYEHICVCVCVCRTRRAR